MTAEQQSLVSRRTVAKGIAWSTPILAMGVATPAYAVQSQPCGTLTFTRSTETTGSTLFFTVTAAAELPCIGTLQFETMTLTDPDAGSTTTFSANTIDLTTVDSLTVSASVAKPSNNGWKNFTVAYRYNNIPGTATFHR